MKIIKRISSFVLIILLFLLLSVTVFAAEKAFVHCEFRDGFTCIGGNAECPCAAVEVCFAEQEDHILVERSLAERGRRAGIGQLMQSVDEVVRFGFVLLAECFCADFLLGDLHTGDTVIVFFAKAECAAEPLKEVRLGVVVAAEHIKFCAVLYDFGNQRM